MSPKPSPLQSHADRFLQAVPNYRHDLARFLSLAASLGFDALALRRVEAVRIRDELASKYAASTVHVTLSAARSFYTHLQDYEVVEQNPLLGLRFRGRREIPMWNVLQADQVGKLMAAVKGTGLEARRDRVILLVLLETGVRASEICRWSWGDLHEEGDGWLVSYMGKLGKGATVWLSKSVVEVAEQATGGNSRPHPTDPLIAWDGKRRRLTRFLVYQVVKRYTKRLGLRVSPHGLRATFISRAIREGGIEVARQKAHHDAISTTVRYSRWLAEEGK